MPPGGRGGFAAAAVPSPAVGKIALTSIAGVLMSAAAEETQFLAPSIRPEEDELERSLRPRNLAEFVGQERVKEQLAITLEAARGRKEALDHLLQIGPPGLGKTSLAYIVREELGVGLRTVAGPALERKGDVAAILTGLGERDVLFVDEIHRLSSAVEEILYPALEHYEPDELALIVRRSARILGVEISGDASTEIAGRARGTPRIANRILRRVRDVAEVRHQGKITVEIAREALELMEVDGDGLERSDRALLQAIVEKFDGGPVGLSTLAVTLGEEPDTIEDVYEPYLLQLGFIQRTPRGRIVTKLGRAHVGAPAKADDERLF